MPINRPFIRLQLLSSIKGSTHSLGHCTGNKIHPQNLSFLPLVPLCYNSQLKSSQVRGKEWDFFNKDTAPKAVPEHGRDLTWNGSGKELGVCAPALPRAQVSRWEWNNQEISQECSEHPTLHQATSWLSWESGHVLQDPQELVFLINTIWVSKYPQKCNSLIASATFSAVSARQEKDNDNVEF